MFPAEIALAVPDFFVVGMVLKVAKQHFSFVADVESSVLIQSVITLSEASYSHREKGFTPQTQLVGAFVVFNTSISTAVSVEVLA